MSDQPTTPDDLAEFPAHTLPAGTPLYRIHRAARSPWWYSSDGTGRFDLPAPHGTCYLAEEPLATLLEVARGLTLLSEEFLSTRRLLTATLAAELRLADLTTPGAYRFGVTGEVATTTDYTGPQAWAAALYRAGFEGLRYHVRHDPRAELYGVARFRPAGGGPAAPGRSQELPAGLLLEAAPFGIRLAASLPPEP